MFFKQLTNKYKGITLQKLSTGTSSLPFRIYRDESITSSYMIYDFNLQRYKEIGATTGSISEPYIYPGSYGIPGSWYFIDRDS